MKELYAKYSSWDWLYGKTPQFDIVFETRFPWGGIDLGLTLRNARITDAKIYSDAMNANLIEQIGKSFIDLPLKGESIIDALDNLVVAEEDREVIIDIGNWLRTKVDEL